jgi:hypothetical protein
MRQNPISISIRSACLITLFSLPMVASSSWGSSSVFRCENADGSTTLSQFPCGNQSQAIDVNVGSGKKGHGPTGLSAAEREMLNAVQERKEDRAEEQIRLQKAEAKEARQLETARFRCSKAKDHLEVVREEGRKGYSARQARYYKQRLQEAKDYVEQQCSAPK